MERSHSRFLTGTQTKMTRRDFLSTPPYPRPSSPLLPHPVRRVCVRFRIHKPLHHRRLIGGRSEMQRGISILRRAAALRHALHRGHTETHNREWVLLFRFMPTRKLTSAGRKLANAVVTLLEIGVPKTGVSCVRMVGCEEVKGRECVGEIVGLIRVLNVVLCRGVGQIHSRPERSYG